MLTNVANAWAVLIVISETLLDKIILDIIQLKDVIREFDHNPSSVTSHKKIVFSFREFQGIFESQSHFNVNYPYGVHINIVAS